MAKITLNDIINTYNLTLINSNFTKIEDEFQNKVFFRVRNKSGANAQTIYTQVIENGAVVSISANATGAEDMTLAKTLTINHNVANAADTNRIQGVDIAVTH